MFNSEAVELSSLLIHPQIEQIHKAHFLAACRRANELTTQLSCIDPSDTKKIDEMYRKLKVQYAMVHYLHSILV